ncbi:MAG: flagellar hook-basal body complex protein [Deltaproteobacteria bacterium]|jgi:flagellar hook-basal body protein|nr:flagellar hook-basal body complex protein [Deltaproteobacteria bacterium]
MSISSAMYAAVTGLSALSTGMQVISNNIANVNTVGFKAARTNFEDLISQDYLSNGRIQQIGRGVKVASVQQMFTQGAFINSAQDTDMAIAGEGFFQVRDRVTNELMYTRAGNFTFDANGVLETPAGYVLQGWELSIPKPGAEAVRIGVPTDVKVVILNAPPVETSQIKVVCNLNADDSSAYIYNSAEFAVMYANQKAVGPAESARIAAAEAVYNFSSHGSAYINVSSAFNRAYVSIMSGLGYVETAPGSSAFVKTTTLTPDPAEIKAAAQSASAAAWTLVAPTGTYPETSTSTLYNANFNSAYSHYMKDVLEYEENVNTNTFYKTVKTPAAQVDLTAAKAYAENSVRTHTDPTFGSYPSTASTAANAAYLNAYSEYMVNTAGYTAAPPDFRTTPTGGIGAVAMAAGAASAQAVLGTFSSYPSGNAEADLAYLNAFSKYLAENGYSLDPAYPDVPNVPNWDPNPNATEYATAQSSGMTAALAVDGTYGTYPSGNKVADLAYVAGMAKNLFHAGYDLDGAYPTPTTPGFTTPPTAPDAIAANLAGESAAKAVTGEATFTYPSTNQAANLAYVAAYANSLVPAYTIDPSYVLPATEPAITDFDNTPTAYDLSMAVNAGRAAAVQIEPGFISYATSTNAAAKIAYVYGYTHYLDDLGYNIDSGYQPGVGYPATFPETLFTRPANATEIAAADALGVAAAQSLNAPSTYSYPSGDAAWDAAYLGAYNAGFPGGFSSSPNITNFQKVTVNNPTTAEETAATTLAKNAGRAALGFPATYPISTSDAAVEAAYNNTYRDYMVNVLNYVQVSGPPYFTKTATSSPTPSDILTAQALAKAAAQTEASNAGQIAYDLVYQVEYQLALSQLTGFSPWQLEGMGFAGAWDGTDLKSPIDPENYTHANPWTIYDSLGTAHTLMVYYQPNPYMENVWDYIITCDPTEDARKDINNDIVGNGATFAGLIQKGKITFTADGPDRHGGEVKDIEAQNIDLSKTAVARLTSASASIINPATASSMNFAEFGGYYTGEPVFSAATGSLVPTKREYVITWAGNLNTVPAVSGFVWSDLDGNSGTIPVYEKNYTGPYPFGSGLTINFDKGGTPMRFTSGDSMTLIANSEAIGWTNLTPNAEGYFDFDVAFVQSATMALHPPYPPGMPTIIQHIAVDMGARNPNGERAEWILDEQGTTQYASKSLNIFSSQDGYPAGSLQRVSIDKDGILTGIYTNGRHQPLYQIGLTRFLNPWGLSKLGDNVYMETRWSGTGTINPPGYGGTGTIRANFLEQSNTDLADEIVNMIVTQRGFQANSKVVTTTDTMLAEVIEMKR